MLTSLVLLAALQSTAPAHSEGTRITASPMPNLGRTLPGCENRVMAASGETARSDSLIWRQGDPPVGHYLLLERQVGGCPAPVIVGYRSLGETDGQATAPNPPAQRIVVPRP